MKQLITSAIFMLMVVGVSAQDARYMKVMQEKVAAVDTTYDIEKLKDLSASFERIALAEKTQWLPYYYAALTHVNMGLMMSTQGAMPAEKADPIADKAEELISKAIEINKEHSDIYIIKKMIANLRMMPGEMTRYMQYGPEGAAALEMARKLDPQNPRVSLLEGQDKFYTPEQFGGSKTEAKKLFEDALKKFETFKPASAIDPNWGKSTALYFLNQIK